MHNATRHRALAWFATPLLVTGLLSQALAADPAANYPSRLMTAIVAANAGTSVDVLMRVIGEQLSSAWKQPVVVENRPGASGTIGYAAIANAAPDGHTMGFAVTNLIQTPFLLPSVPYDPYTDLAPVIMLARGANVFAVHQSVPAKTLPEFIELVKANPGKYAFGSYGNGTTAHILGETLNRSSGMDLLHAPYKGSGPMITDLLGGQIPAAFPDVATAMRHLDGGQIRPLAISGTERYASLPDVPTFAELGIEGLEPYGWYGILVPGKTPRPIVEKLSQEIQRIVQTPEMNERMQALGLQIVGSSPDDFAQAMREDAKIWQEAIEQGNIRPQ